MKPRSFLYHFFINTLALYFIILLIPGVTLTDGLEPLLLSGLVLTFLNKLAKPLLKLLLLPFNLLTLGLFRWLINVITLYLLTLVVSSLKIQGFVFPGLSYQGFVIPSVNLNTLYTYILASFILSLITSLLRWLTKK